MSVYLRSLLFLWLLFFGQDLLQGQCNLFIIPTVTYNCNTNQAYIEIPVNGTAPPPYAFTVTSLGGVDTGTTATSTGTAPYYGVGNYNVFLVAANGCTTQNTAIVTPSFSTALIVGSVSYTNASCFGVPNGSAVVTPPTAFNAGPFTFSWIPGGFTTQAVSSLSANVVYTVITGNPAQGCQVSNTLQVGQPNQINSTLSNTFASCFGGTIVSAPSSTGGFAPYTYSLNGLAASPPFTLSAGVYSLQTRDHVNCIRGNTLLISEAPQVIISFTALPPKCPGDANGSLSAFFSNAPLPLFCQWQPPGNNSSQLNNIPAGSYTLTVTDGSACATTSVGNVPAAVPILSSVQTQPENCSAADGAFTIQASGGVPPFTFSTIPVNSTSSVQSNLSSGTYTTYIRDFNLCVDTLIFVVGNLSTVSLSIVQVNTVTCHDACSGSVQLNAINGTAPYTYSASGLPASTLNVLQGLCPGSYFISVLDANACPASTSLILSNPPALSYSVAQPSGICIGQSLTVQAQAGGGTGVYSYNWQPGNYNTALVQLSPSLSTIYSLQVFDANLCTLQPYTFTVNVNPPLSVSVNPNGTGICPGTTAQITPTVSGGDGQYTYLWLPGNSAESGLYIENISIPEYTFIVSDGCGTPPAVQVIPLEIFEVENPSFSSSVPKGCAPLCVSFTNTTPGSLKVYWNFGDDANDELGEQAINCYQNSGQYNILLTVLDQHSCTAASWFSKAVDVYPQPLVDFITEPAVITRSEAASVKLISVTNEAKEFLWRMDGEEIGSESQVVLSLPDTICYMIQLIARSSLGCVDSTQKPVCVVEDFNFFVPNVFTPNADGLNDLLLPQGTGWKKGAYYFALFNQWGERIFHTEVPGEGWDGDYRLNDRNAKYPKTDQQDAYLWVAELEDLTGTVHKLSGSVLLLR